MEVLGIDHVYLSVSDLARSERFYDPVMELLGFRKGDKRIAGEPHVHYFNPALQVSLRPARGTSGHDPYAPGLHHLCLQVADVAAVRAAADGLTALGVECSAPARYPEYHPDYFATFFEDPDGIRLEIVARTPHREEIARRWSELRAFLNPLAELHARDARRAEEDTP
jgi:catechol 2,3-dioxygenase-like lactoylglutathione lyase family enzyme